MEAKEEEEEEEETGHEEGLRALMGKGEEEEEGRKKIGIAKKKALFLSLFCVPCL